MGASQESVKYKLEHEKEYLKKINYNEEKTLQQELNKIQKLSLSTPISYKVTFESSKC